jgi:hypothetical protein
MILAGQSRLSIIVSQVGATSSPQLLGYSDRFSLLFLSCKASNARA